MTPVGEEPAPCDLSPAQVDAMLGLISEVAAMRAPPAERRRRLLGRLCGFVGADSWMWARQHDSDSAPLVVYGDASSRAGGVDCAPPGGARMAVDLFSMRQHGNHFIASAGDPVAEAVVFEDAWLVRHGEVYGVSALVASMYPLGSLWSVIALLGHDGHFASAHHRMAHMVLSEVTWLHDERLLADGWRDVHSLLPREREVLRGLLAGRSRQEVAVDLGLSEHTVKDYIKVLYRHLGVRTRGELHAHFATHPR